MYKPLTALLIFFGLTDLPGEEPDTGEKAGSVRGRLVLRIEGLILLELGPVVVYLEACDGKAKFPVPGALKISQKKAKFSPNFLVITAGQTVEWPNDDRIVHNVFSYSKGNKFDLGLYPKGEMKRVKFQNPGLVRVYCSIHESMNASIFVAPLPYFDRVKLSGSFEISGVPPGKYRLKTWNNRVPEVTRDIEVVQGKETLVEVPIAEKGPGSE
jgi:plastocyanin